MRIFFACMTAACALAAAAPAAAQYVDANANSMAEFENRIAQIETRIQTGIRSGAIDRTEAAGLRQQLRALRSTYRIYSRNGISQSERVDLQARVRALRQDIRLADGGRYDRNGNRIETGAYAGQRYDRNGRPDANGMYDRQGNRIEAGVYAGQRYDRYGRPDANGMYDRQGNRIEAGVYAGQRYDRYGRPDANGMYDRQGNRIDAGVYAGQRYDRYGRPDANGMYDRNGNRIDVGVYAGQRYDRYGRPDANGMYDREGNRIDVGVSGQGGPYEPVDEYCVDRGGIGGIIDDIFGGDDCDRTSLRVGSRVSGNLGAVPSEHRWRYRDGNGVYYRSDGRNIYQIDARTQTVLRIYDIDR